MKSNYKGMKPTNIFKKTVDAGELVNEEKFASSNQVGKLNSFESREVVKSEILSLFTWAKDRLCKINLFNPKNN